MRIAVITGASIGLGRAFALAVDRTEKDIDAIWLIARRKDRLEALAEEMDTPARVFAMDLTQPESIDAFEEALAAEPSLEVGLLIACAGFGKIGNAHEISRRDCDRMLDLNGKAAMDMTLAVIPYMQAGDRILEICSTSAFQPLPQMNVYAASKAFLYRFARGLRMELMRSGIIVTAVCPWWIKETEFIDVARGQAGNQAVRHFPFASKPRLVAEHALRDSRLGLEVSTPGLCCTLHRMLAKILPHKVMVYGWEGLRRV